MKNKQRVLALDYFRGLCMIIVIINHFAIFANPLTILAGGGRLWVSAAELFFLISGITFAVARGKNISRGFGEVVKKSFKRAALLYGINLLTVVASLAVAFQLSAANRFVNIPGELPAGGAGHTALQILSLQYNYGWADFLMFYAVFLLVAPFALRILFTRAWAIVPILSVAFFSLTASQTLHMGPYFQFFVWQVYFFVGMALGRFRLDILGQANKLNIRVRKALAYSIAAAGGLVLAASLLAGYSERINNSALPQAVKALAIKLGSFQASSDFWLYNNRTGLARPLVSLLVLATLYVTFQKLKKPLLKCTGNFVMSFGRNSLQIFVLQAMAIPLIAALPLRQDSYFLNMGLTCALIFSIWLVTHKWSPLPTIRTAFGSCYSGMINFSYILMSNLRAVKDRLSSPELD